MCMIVPNLQGWQTFEFFTIRSQISEFFASSVFYRESEFQVATSFRLKLVNFLKRMFSKV